MEGQHWRRKAGAHNYRIMGLELASPPGTLYPECRAARDWHGDRDHRLPNSITLDRLYIHGDRVAGGKRGSHPELARPQILPIPIFRTSRAPWQDAQAICGWNGPGPFQIINNYLEASGENVMFGGALTSIPEHGPIVLSP